jgi:hypothetical protein
MSLDDESTLSQDGAVFEPISRVAYRHGMMLGVEALRDEQAFFRRRLSRHQYWLHGAGTVVGLAVTLDHGSVLADTTRDQAMQLVVSPGIALDGLGREVVLTEAYCLDLRAWIEANRDEDTREWTGSNTHIPQQGGLWLEVGIRQQDCDRGLQPVVAAEVNSGIDPVATSRIEQSVALEIRPITPADPDPDALATPEPPRAPLPGAAHPGAPADLGALLNPVEQAYLGAVEGENPSSGALLRLHADRLFRLRDSDLTPEKLTETLSALARVPLARLRLATLGDLGLVSHPSRVAINNLVRPFVTHPDLLRWVLTNHQHPAPE